ncbi:hypothetical protein LCGC14_2433500, partial [marine sediment metagenome]
AYPWPTKAVKTAKPKQLRLTTVEMLKRGNIKLQRTILNQQVDAALVPINKAHRELIKEIENRLGIKYTDYKVLSDGRLVLRKPPKKEEKEDKKEAPKTQ